MNNSKLQDYTLEQWLNKARSATKETNPKAAELIASSVLKLNKTEVLAKSKECKLNPKNTRKLNNQLGKLLAGRSLSSILKYTHFHNINLKINPRVLSPRAETEQLVEYAIDNIPEGSTVLDIGTGSGAIGIAIAKARPDLRVILTDIDKSALNLAKLNAKRNKVKNLEFKVSNLIKKVDQDILVNAANSTFFIANLPYVNETWQHINKKRLSFEPRSALFAKNMGLQLIFNLISDLQEINALSSKNWLLLEHDPIQFKMLSEFCNNRNLHTEKITDFISKVKLK